MNLLETLTGKGREASSWPLVHVRDTTVFPHALTQFLASTKSSIQAVVEAMRHDRRVFVALERAESGKQADDDVHPEGTLARIIQQIRLPDGTLKLLIEGERRGRISKFTYHEDFISVTADFFPVDDDITGEISALMQACLRSFAQYADTYKKIPPETMTAAERAETPHKLCDIVAGATGVKPAKKQELLAIVGAAERLEATCAALESEIEILALQRKISQKVKSRMDRNQKDYYLQEQIREINRELGKETDVDEGKELEARIASKNPGEEALARARKEIAKLSKLQPFSPEAGIIRNYVEWLADLPWAITGEESKDLAAAEEILERDHYALEKAKDRILEYIAVRHLNGGQKGPILCFLGPPGTGKTSLGKSVARALGRNFIRISLGGVRDEAEIRGHRRTYVGALPGRIIQSMKKAGTCNPVFLLDEIDKMSSDFRGDPASALLEVLDPEQNPTFQDHYLELPYDLSKVMFITTANSIQGIPSPLLDRMEVIEIPGYSETEKLEIARRYVIPRILAENGLDRESIEFGKEAILETIRKYTMESGVRGLERELSRIVRKTARKAVSEGRLPRKENAEPFRETIGSQSVRKLLGKPRRREEPLLEDAKCGVAFGLAWTEAGGTLLPVEAVMFPGAGNLILTGNLGDVMKESARTALSWIRANSSLFSLPEIDFQKTDFHIHVPEGAIPKDGPSAGVTLTMAILSLISGKPPERIAAMTGEMTLSGRILAVGGIKEKVLAAHRNGVKSVLLPEANALDYEEVPKEVRKALKVTWCSTMEEAARDLLPGLRRA